MPSPLLLFNVFIVSWAGVAVILSRHVADVREGSIRRPHVSLEDYIAPAVSHLDRVWRFALRGLKKAFYGVILFVLAHFTPWFERFANGLVRRLQRVTDTISGKGVVKSNGNASAFLKDIKEHKAQNGTKPEELEM